MRAAGRAHDDVGATLESLDLGLEGNAAVDLNVMGRQVSAASRRSCDLRRASRVGRIIRACGLFAGAGPRSPSSGAMTSSRTGMPKPRVLPVPALAYR